MVAPAARADVTRDANEVVWKSALTLKTLLGAEGFDELTRFVEQSRAVLVFPALFKGGFIIGAEGGTGVLLARGADGSWSPPAFFTLVSGSIGLQIGGQVSEAVLTVMNDGALDAILHEKIKLGADISLAVGPLGKGIEASTTANFDADVYAFARPVGLFGGGSIEGGGLFTRESLNTAFYDAPAATPEEIVLERVYFNPEAEDLRNALPR